MRCGFWLSDIIGGIHRWAFAANEPSQDRYKHYVIKSPLNDKYSSYGWDELASGLAAVWARDNTREALFEAMRRKETYATTGSRITVRFFGGWDYQEGDAERSDMVEIGYTKGVPMGGDLMSGTAGKSPTFMVAALRDPMGANLDRIQIVKGWMDAAGELHEKVYNVVVSDGRTIGANGEVQAVGTTVDLSNASYTNSIGDAELRALWRDPEFDPAQRAVYYARVLEIPTPTWIAHDEYYFHVKVPDGLPKMGQDRAYTSPIWYLPRETPKLSSLQ